MNVYPLKKTGLFFGSFNPIHIGHLIIADYFVKFTEIDNIWFVVSPQNPLKLNKYLLNDKKRLRLVRLAIENNPAFEATDVEFTMKQPSYSYNTLKHFISKYPEKDFILIIGSDNLVDFDKWRNYDEILEMIDIFVYPRLGFDKSRFLEHKKVHLKSAPILEISSSYIRKCFAENKDPKYLLPKPVYDEINENNYYKKNR